MSKTAIDYYLQALKISCSGLSQSEKDAMYHQLLLAIAAEDTTDPRTLDDLENVMTRIQLMLGRI